MCLGVPGEVLSIDRSDSLMVSGLVSFAGVEKEVCLALVPEVEVGEFVIVHVGFAISRIDADAARETYHYLDQLQETVPGKP